MLVEYVEFIFVLPPKTATSNNVKSVDFIYPIDEFYSETFIIVSMAKITGDV